MNKILYTLLTFPLLFLYSCAKDESNQQQLYEIGQFTEGGIVFYIDNSGEHGLIAAMEDINNINEWGCLSTYVDGADKFILGSGYQNTLDIINFDCITELGDTNTASELSVELIHNGFDDWYLPSRDELYYMYLNIGKGGIGENYNVGMFSNSSYWSSTESNSFNAWTVNFTTGSSISMLKNTFSNQVRAIRSF